MKNRIFISFLILLLFFACAKTENLISDANHDVQENTALQSSQNVQEDKITESSSSGSASSETIKTVSSGKEFSVSFGGDSLRRVNATAHSKYLDDPAVFTPLESSGFEYKDSFVIGSDVARFYEGFYPDTGSDLDKIPEGIPVPIGTILPNLGMCVNKKDEYDSYYNFEDNYNYFYKTEYKGEEGTVFGSDLKGIYASKDVNEVYSHYYKKGAVTDRFYPLSGLSRLSDEMQEELEENRLVLESMPAPRYLDNDDMIDFYRSTSRNKQQAVFITTDLAAHTLHLVFDRFLQKIEEEMFTPRLLKLIQRYLDKINRLIEEDDGSAEEYTRTLEIAKAYFEVPEAVLLGGLAESGGDESGRISTPAKDKVTIYSEYSENVQEELKNIEEAKGWVYSPDFKYCEDFSQYKPRGHYTRNEILKAYFKAMMWFGRMHFYIAWNDEPPDFPMDCGQPAGEMTLSSTDLSLRLAPVAALVTEITRGDEYLFDLWESLFEPITYLVGISDDLSFIEFMPFWENMGIDDLPGFSADRESILEMMKKAYSELRPPAIAGNSMVFVPAGPAPENPEEGESEYNKLPPMGWRLFGQRFTYDSSVHMKVSDPRLKDRWFIRGLDIMAAFGSETAYSLLKPEFGGYQTFQTRIDDFRDQFDSYDAGFWGESYYNRTLFMIRSQAQFEQGTGFYFTETPMWDIKALLASHGTWAELRHDTILYVKQVYGAERGGGGDIEPTFRTKPLPMPVSYVEPNLPFWEGSLATAKDLYNNLAQRNLLISSTESQLQSLINIFDKCVSIVEKEVADQNVPDNDLAYIRTIPEKMAGVTAFGDSYGDYVEDQDKLKMAVIADVYTAVMFKQVVEIGVGVPYKMTVLLNDGQGGKRVAVGYTYSYYEFKHPMSDRMTDEQWKELVYKGNGVDNENYLPDWMKAVLK